MAQISRSVVLKAPASEVWALIGPFQALPDWHPAVASATKEDIGGVEHRRLHLEGGGEILEKLMGTDTGTHARSYGYEIVESPLPVSSYFSTLTLVDAGDRSVVAWSSTFEPTADNAGEVIAGIYEAGLGTLADRFGR